MISEVVLFVSSLHNSIENSDTLPPKVDILNMSMAKFGLKRAFRSLALGQF